MRNVLVEMMCLVFVILYMFQPTLNELHARRSYAVEMVLDSKIEKAANGDNGYFKPVIISELKNDIKSIAGYEPSEITFSGTTTLTDRGQYIYGEVRVPRKQLWIIPNIFTKDNYNKEIVKTATQMSEYIIR